MEFDGTEYNPEFFAQNENARMKAALDSILCLVVEGPEVMGKLELCKAVEQEVLKGLGK